MVRSRTIDAAAPTVLDRGVQAHTVADSLPRAVLRPATGNVFETTVEQLVRLGIPKLLYVACDPATLARDAKLLVEAGYTLQQVQPIDMFPQTFHVECLALFTLHTL